MSDMKIGEQRRVRRGCHDREKVEWKGIVEGREDRKLGRRKWIEGGGRVGWRM
jgi:hypothetical protein